MSNLSSISINLNQLFVAAHFVGMPLDAVLKISYTLGFKQEQINEFINFVGLKTPETTADVKEEAKKEHHEVVAETIKA